MANSWAPPPKLLKFPTDADDSQLPPTDVFEKIKGSPTGQIAPKLQRAFESKPAESGLIDTSKLALLRQQLQPLPADATPATGLDPGTPQLEHAFDSAPQPRVVRAPTPGEQEIANTQQALQKVRWNEANPWGTAENHPGKLGKLAHAFSTLGNIAGDIFAPGAMVRIPGTQLNMQEREGDLAKRLETETTTEANNARLAADTAHTNAETPQIAPNDQSKRELEGAQADKLRHPQEEWQPVTGWQGPNGEPMEYSKTSGAYRPAPGGTGASLQKPPIDTEESKTATFMPPGSKVPVEFQWNPQTKRYDIPLGQHYERPESPSAGDASLDRLAGRLGKPYESAFEKTQATFDRIQQTMHSIDAGYVGQGLAIPELLTALVSGQGTGVRVTQAELNAITAHRGIQGSAESWFNGLAGKGNLTDTDKAQVRAVLGEARQRLEVKQSIMRDALDSINGAGTRAEIQQADKLARQRITEYEQHGFYTGQKLAQGTVVGFKDGKVQIDDAH